jgi:elongation factor P
MEMIGANSIRSGNILVLEDELWVVTKLPVHTKPGKGPAYVQVEMKNLLQGTKSNQRFKSSDVVKKAHLQEEPYLYLYLQESSAYLMHAETFEQIELPLALIEEEKKFLVENLKVSVAFFNEKPVKLTLPQTITMIIQDTPPNIKSATAKAAYKKAQITQDLTVLVPSYLSVGDKIVVKTEDGSFLEKAQ